MRTTIFQDTWQITKRDLIEFSRDHLRLVTFIIMPIFMMLLTGFIFPSQNTLKDIPLGIANQDNQKISQKFVTAITDLKLTDDKKSFRVKEYADLDAIKEGIKKQEISGGILITNNFSKLITQNKQVTVTIIEDQSNPQTSSMINQVLTKMVDSFANQIGTEKVGKILIAETKVSSEKQLTISPAAIVKPIQAKLEGIIPGNPSYFEFVAPGIIAMVVMTAVLTGLAASIAREKEQGTLDGLLISPISRISIILGKALSQSIRGLIQGGIILLLAILLFGVTIHGNIFLIILLLLLGIFSFVGLGILVSAIASEQETATQLLFMFQFPMLFLSGTFFPILMMPKFMQIISKAIPLSYAINALRKVMILGAGLGAVKIEILVLALFGAITITISVPIFKRVITK